MLMRSAMTAPDASTAPTAFAAWLRQAMQERNISGAGLARLVNEQLPDGHFAASNISHYLSGRSRPRRVIQTAIERALASIPANGHRRPPSTLRVRPHRLSRKTHQHHPY